jgi:hypothetical protein
MASEITPGQRLIVLAVAADSPLINDEDSGGAVIEVHVPDDDGQVCLLNPADVFPLDDLREVLRGAKAWQSSMLRIASEIEGGVERMRSKCCDTWWDGGKRNHWQFCIVMQLRGRAELISREQIDALLSRLGGQG